MATMQNQYSPMPAASGAGVRRADGMDWTQEISVPRPGSSQTPGGEQRFEGGMTPTVSGAQESPVEPEPGKFCGGDIFDRDPGHCGMGGHPV